MRNLRLIYDQDIVIAVYNTEEKAFRAAKKVLLDRVRKLGINMSNLQWEKGQNYISLAFKEGDKETKWYLDIVRFRLNHVYDIDDDHSHGENENDDEE